MLTDWALTLKMTLGGFGIVLFIFVIIIAQVEITRWSVGKIKKE